PRPGATARHGVPGAVRRGVHLYEIGHRTRAVCARSSPGRDPMKSFAASNAYVSAVHDLIPGGAHTYAKGDDQYPDGMAPVIERGAGCRVWDVDGNEYVEFGSGLRSNLLGHGFEPVVRAARGWLEDGVNFVRPHRIEL